MSRTKEMRALDSMRSRGVTIPITGEMIMAAIETGEPLILNEDQVDETIDRARIEMAKKFLNDFGDLYKENLEYQLENLEGTAKKPKTILKQGNISETRSLRKQIIDTIKLERKVADNGDYTNIIEIKHPLTRALNYGTGIYGEKRQPITAKHKKYMFIPGIEFARGFSQSKLKAHFTKTNIKKDAYSEVRKGVRARRNPQKRQDGN